MQFTASSWQETELPEADDWSEEQQLAGEYAVLGFYISGHPLDKYAGRLKDLNAAELATMESRKNNEDIIVAGIIVQIRPMRSRRGARWAILTLQDRTGVIEALVFPEAFGKLERDFEIQYAAAGQGPRSGGRRRHALDRRGCALARSGGGPSAQLIARAHGFEQRRHRRARPACRNFLQPPRALPRGVRI